MTSSVAEIQIFRTYPAIFDSVTLPHVSDVTVSAQIERMKYWRSGSLDPSFVAEINRKPEASISTPDLSSVISNVSLTTGLEFSTLAKLQFQRQLGSGLSAANSGKHVTIKATKGCVYVDEISAAQDDKNGAMAKLMVQGLKDSANADKAFEPVVDQNLTGTLAFPGAYTIGPIWLSINSTWAQLRGSTSHSVKPGITFNRHPTDGDHTAQTYTFSQREPVVEVEGLNLHLAGGSNLGMFPIDAVVVFFRRVKSGGGFYADSDTEHISISGSSGGGMNYEQIGVSGDAEAKPRYAIHLTGQLTTAVGVEIADPGA